MLEGDLGDFSLPDVLRLLSFTSKSGRLQLVGAEGTGRIDLVGGRVSRASLHPEGLVLARLLVDHGLVDADALRDALGRSGGGADDDTLVRNLVAQGRVDEEALGAPFREQTIGVAVQLGRWREGSFRFDPRSEATTDPGPLAMPVDELLSEVDRRLAAHAVLDEAEGRRPAPAGRPVAAPPAPADVAAVPVPAPEPPSDLEPVPAPEPPSDAGDATPADQGEGDERRADDRAEEREVASEEPEVGGYPAPAPKERTREARTGKLRQDPDIDEDLVNRLIAGIREL